MFRSHRFLVPALSLGVFLAQQLTAADGLSGNLVTVQWLEKNLRNADVLILDASPAETYAANHIPGAVNVSALGYGRPDASLAEMEGLFQSWGVSPGKTIVIYDQGGNMMAPRTFFALLNYGFQVKDLLILDGGFNKWQAAALPVASQATSGIKPGSFKVTALNRDVKAELPEVLAATGDPANNALVEALDGGWHFGGIAAFNRSGHIPTGILLPSADFYNPDKTFKSPDDIRKMAAYVGIRPEQQIYTYCGGGVAAAVPFFAFKFILNYPNVKLFTGSELAWVSDERELPYWTYDAPYLMRNTRWLQFWGGAMIRTFMSPRVSIVDIRPRAAYDQGHVPFAVNIPADVFADNLANPRKFVQLLSQSGVDPSQEAVIISGAGLSKESALAFVMLERLHQKKISIFMDSMEQWRQLGFTLTKQPTAVGTTEYPYDPRRGVLTSDLSKPGLYPRVFIASGKEMPAQAQDGKMVHVPYTTLLDNQGSPKAAKDIWNILSKAGVPRFAQLVVVADDPADAAVNYFILKLMGYPDVKVFVTECGCTLGG